VIASVVADTNVFTASLQGTRSALAAPYVKHTVGRRIVVAPQTVAEARYGALVGGWGPRRLDELARTVSAVVVLDVDDETIEQVARSDDPEP